MERILAQPRLLGAVCGACAVGLGVAYLALADAPAHYAPVNLVALALGVGAWVVLSRPARSRLAGAGAVVLVLAGLLLLTALFGVSVEGATRWVSVGLLSLQTSLLLLPAMIVLYARRPDATGTAGMVAAALALAIQPDRAMAGALAAGLVAIALADSGSLPWLAAGLAILAFGWTLVLPDQVPAVPHVEGVLFTAFELHPALGLAVAMGAVLLVLPVAAASAQAADDQPALLAFGGCWFAALVASSLGNYPTPLVGYGASSVLGYLLSAAVLPSHARAREP